MKDVNKYTEFAERFLSEMGRKGCTATEIASLLGITKQSVSNYTSGKSIPPIDKLHKLADYFNVTLDWLLCRPGAKRAADVDIGYICNYTGLSEKAISRLHLSSNEADMLDWYQQLERLIAFCEPGECDSGIIELLCNYQDAVEIERMVNKLSNPIQKLKDITKDESYRFGLRMQARYYGALLEMQLTGSANNPDSVNNGYDPYVTTDEFLISLPNIYQAKLQTAVTLYLQNIKDCIEKSEHDGEHNETQK